MQQQEQQQQQQRPSSIVIRNRLHDIHERMIDKVSSIQNRWIKQRCYSCRSALLSNSNIDTDDIGRSMTDEEECIGGVSKTTTTTTTPTAFVAAHQHWTPQDQARNSTTTIIRRKKLSIMTPQSRIQQKIQLLQRHNTLRKHRIALVAQTKVIRSQSTPNQRYQYHPVPFHALFRSSSSDASYDDDASWTIDELATLRSKMSMTKTFASNNSNDIGIWDNIRTIRQNKCIQAAYRCTTGISCTTIATTENHDYNNGNGSSKSNNKLFKIQFDIGQQYYYECVFDLVVTSPLRSSPRSLPFFFLRLMHHTVPSAIPIVSIMKRYCTTTTTTTTTEASKTKTVTEAGTDLSNDTTVLIPVGSALSQRLFSSLEEDGNNKESDCDHDDLVVQEQNQQLQNISQHIYNACYILHVRNDIYQYLLQLQSQTTTNKSETVSLDGTCVNGRSSPYSIYNVHCTTAYVPKLNPQEVQHPILNIKSIQFDIEHCIASIDHIYVQLQYDTDLRNCCNHHAIHTTLPLAIHSRQSNNKSPFLPISVQVSVIQPSDNVTATDNKHKNRLRKKRRKTKSSRPSSNRLSSLFLSSSVLINQLQQHDGVVTDVEIEDENDNNSTTSLDNNDDLDELIDTITRTFRNKPIQEAIKCVIHLMSD